MTTHISYKTAKMLKEFLGESAPEPMELVQYSKKGNLVIESEMFPFEGTEIPAYQLHDLLSKTLCLLMGRKCKGWDTGTGMGGIEDYWDFAIIVLDKYQKGGLPAVEKALEEMIKGER